MYNPLHNYKILVADTDQKLAQVLKALLSSMGFRNAQIVRGGQDALKAIEETTYDFLITEWNLPQIDGLGLLHEIRHGTTDPALPVMMLTGRAEQSDVAAARDSGINEYVVKPFSAKTVFSRLERIVEHPRNFVLSQHFVGPDRRYKALPPEGMKERRTHLLEPQRAPKSGLSTLINNTLSVPKILLPDYALKRKLGQGVTLPSLITPTVLSQAQATIDAISDDSLQWIKDNLTELKFLLQAVSKEKNSPEFMINEMGEVALTLRARAGTFGYLRASEVAYMIYLFCRNHMKPGNATHITIVQKHIEVLQVILGNATRGATDDGLTEIIAALKTLVSKYAT